MPSDNFESKKWCFVARWAPRNLGGLISRESARKGANLVVHYHSPSPNPEAEQTVQPALENRPGGDSRQGDLTKPAECQPALRRRQRSALVAIDIAINTVGKVLRQSTSWKQAKTILNSSLISKCKRRPISLSKKRQASPDMKKSSRLRERLSWRLYRWLLHHAAERPGGALHARPPGIFSRGSRCSHRNSGPNLDTPFFLWSGTPVSGGLSQIPGWATNLHQELKEICSDVEISCQPRA